MKKTIMTLAIVLGLGMASFAQGGAASGEVPGMEHGWDLDF